MLIETLRAARDSARKSAMREKTDGARIEADLLVTLVSEADRVGKDALGSDGKPAPRAPTDDEVLVTVRKFLKNANETRTALIEGDGSADAINKVDAEIEILNRYMPQQLGLKELTRLIEEFVERTPGANIGAVMGFLAKNHKGLYDGKTANGIAQVAIKHASGT